MGPLSPAQSARFEKALARVQKQQKEEKQRRKEQPHLDFIRAATRAGFAKGQAAFMWEWLAEKHHEHWNGMIG